MPDIWFARAKTSASLFELQPNLGSDENHSTSPHQKSIMTAIPSIACLGVIGKNVTIGIPQPKSTFSKH
jgi:hypothetical protein